MKRCDVIIPIYNAYDAVIDCIKSVLKNTDFKNAHLILIDDKSPDDRMVPLLRKFEKGNPGKITLLLNENNLGFVGTVNRGMKYSKNDVLLLNSDTEVPAGWLDEILSCAYSGELIATVTPLSNNATLASVPVGFQRNELPEGYNLDQMNKMIRDYSLRIYPEIPTAHGFCMFIKREVLEKVGYFDEETFGKGYGEENDFSFRCMRAGYRNVLCDTVYVLHKESQSFLEKKEDHSDLLHRKHPRFTQGLEKWCAAGGASLIYDNVSLALGVNGERPNVLMLIHDFTSTVGGTTLHVLDLIQGMRQKYNVHILYHKDGHYLVKSFFKETEVITGVYAKVMDLTRAMEDTDLVPGEIYSTMYAKMIEEIIDKYQISLVHIHHMLWHYFDIVDVCQKKKIKYMVSLHDMYLEFPIANKFDETVTGEIESPFNLAAWRTATGKLLKNAEVVIAPSEMAKKEYQKFFKDINILVIAHGVDITKIKPRRNNNRKKKIALVGGIGLQKGSEIAEQLIKLLEKQDEVELHLFGVMSTELEESRNFINHGEYERVELPKLLSGAKIDLVCNFSLSFETYAYVVDEVAACGVPTLAFDYGASAERIKQNGLGWVMDYTDDPKVILAEIKKILNDSESYGKILDTINRYKIKSVKEMVGEYENIYKNYLVSKKLDYSLLKDGMIQSNIIASCLYNVKHYDEEVLQYLTNRKVDAIMMPYIERIHDLEYMQNEYEKIINSKRWRIMEKVPIPKVISKIVKKLK